MLDEAKVNETKKKKKKRINPDGIEKCFKLKFRNVEPLNQDKGRKID